MLYIYVYFRSMNESLHNNLFLFNLKIYLNDVKEINLTRMQEKYNICYRKASRKRFVSRP